MREESARCRPEVLLRSWSDSEDVAQALAELALLAAANSCDEYGVVAGDRADDLRPARLVDRDRDALRGTGGGLDDRQRRAGRTHFRYEVGDRSERRAGSAVVAAGKDVVVASLGDAQLAQVAADARLRGIEPLLAQELCQLVLVVHGRLADDPDDRRAPRHCLVNLCCHLPVCIKTRGWCINMQSLSRTMQAFSSHATARRRRTAPARSRSARTRRRAARGTARRTRTPPASAGSSDLCIAAVRPWNKECDARRRRTVRAGSP